MRGIPGRKNRKSPSGFHQRSLLHALTLPALIIDDEGYVTDANPALLQLLSKPAHQVVNQNIGHLLTIEAGVIGDCCPDATQIAEMILSIDDAPHSFELTFSPLLAGDLPSGQLVLFKDITQRKQEEAARTALIVTLESYAGAIAHDLKSPLATVMGFASLLEMTNGEIPAEHRQYARTIQKISGKMATMIDKLLLFATLEKLEHIPLLSLDMSHMANDVVETLGAMVKQYKALVVVAPDMPQAVGYAPWVEVVFANLISNALKYGGLPPEVYIHASQVGDKVFYWVHDNGRGLTEGQTDLLFSHAVRFDPRPKGHGQGLMIARRIIDRLGGEIGVSSLPGTGTTFYFSLPAAEPIVADAKRQIEIEAVRVE
jgi:signal transduction histidine kinase